MAHYTDNPLEQETTHTVPVPADVIALLRNSWPELSETGAKVLCAQFMHETGCGKYCFNWNLGNAKAPATVPHMYLQNTWECLPPNKAADAVDWSNGLAHLATAWECSQHGWSAKPGELVVAFKPPHPQSRFRAYASLADGAQHWLGLHQDRAKSHPEYVAALNGGQVAQVAHILKQTGYYTGDEAAYAVSMAAQYAKL